MWVGLVARENRAKGLVCFSKHLNTDLLGVVCVCVCVCVCVFLWEQAES